MTKFPGLSDPEATPSAPHRAPADCARLASVLRGVQVAEWILLGIALYATAGVVVGAAFVWTGVERVDSVAHGAPWAFRLLILPGSVALWPWLISRWRRAPRVGGES